MVSRTVERLYSASPASGISERGTDPCLEFDRELMLLLAVKPMGGMIAVHEASA